ncbi:MAG: hypothetical protein NVSMB27_35950 [Ktedonobacteraceae bacterium]
MNVWKDDIIWLAIEMVNCNVYMMNGFIVRQAEELVKENGGTVKGGGLAILPANAKICRPPAADQLQAMA